ncbi:MULTISPECIES: elongation factor G-binding protein [Lysinibacillus]|uniref:Elongation factor G-binding protein n=2 Tax=Lysinibacillus capsici TaxID=2115968 RepID=A0ABY8KHV8_9BACI|nr:MULTISPECIES: elongation factor G-binding protein [Lysinibacillus]KMN38528.1 fibronectin-binding protein [Lysinibacillus sp. LK3]MCS5499556.1 elongation factor G-binding protein [Lysinibacillus sp. A4]MDP1393516.1 elongation factor G-binding protein [Lysinibacillus capsici]MDP1414282.1 elongation factor G-binding protein [Lysinibacillus capsici]MDP1430174.1 elongation factor G-binding protein [Lysinibacillus capsici]
MEQQTIQPFLTVANYHLLEQQLNKILHALTTTKDKNVILAVRGLVDTEVTTKLALSAAETMLIDQLFAVTDRAQGDAFLEQLKPYVIPFKPVTASTLKALFKKEKKLKLPNLEALDFQQICYLAWDDAGTHRKYVVLEQNGQLKGIKGIFANNTVRGICAICNRHSDVGLFTTSIKGQVVGTFTNHSNYICADSQTCNEHVTDMNRTLEFFERITQK